MFSYQNFGMRRCVAITLIIAMMLMMIPSSRIAKAAELEDKSDQTITWNFRAGQEGAYSSMIEETIGEFNGMIVDATNGKVAPTEAGDTLVGVGVTLYIPVSGNSTIRVTSVPGYSNYNINSEAVTTDFYEYHYIGEGGFVELASTTDFKLYEISCTRIAQEEDELVTSMFPATEELSTTDKIDVWDFGAEQLNSELYNNKLNAEIINGLYPGVAAGTTGKSILSFSIDGGDLVFADGGKTTHRWRTTNTALTCYDSKSLKSADGLTTYSGFIYSNSSATSAVFLGIQLQKNDILTLVVSSNGGNSTIKVEAPDGSAAEQVFDLGASSLAKVMKFYAPMDGFYKIYSADEKLVVARIYREHTAAVNVSGVVAAPVELTGYQIAFTNTSTNEVISASVVDGYYSVSLHEQYTYQVDLLNANGYVISSSNMLSIGAGEGNKTFDVTVESLSLVTVTGQLTGLSADDLAKLQLTFVSGNLYSPEIKVDAAGSYEILLEAGVNYAILVSGLNDYVLTGDNSISFSTEGVRDFVFEKKTTYPVTVVLNGIDTAAKDSGLITFTNINEAGYSYSFPLNSTDIQLRDGQYSVKVSGTGAYPYAMGLTPDCIVDGTPSTITINYNKVTNWDFAVYNSSKQGPGIETIAGQKYYLGLRLSSTGIAEDKTYLTLNAGSSIEIPVKAGDVVTVNYCYSAAFQFGDDAATLVDESSGSTSKIDTVSYTASADGLVTLKGVAATNSKTYLTSIVVSSPEPYREVITVGASGADYTTINEALDVIRAMNRTQDQIVTVMIQAGNYEEMLVIDVANVHLKNASSTPSTDLINKGVMIAPGAVRITSYYGHGYSYYSMGPDNKYNADTLAVNRANGYLTTHNPGSGTTNGSYWNATVVVYADGFEADGIIFENSFNQYISQKEADDILVLETANRGERSKIVGDTSVQDKAFVERAAALAIADNVKQVYFNNCRFVGRQDTLYGGKGAQVAFNKSQIMGACDFIFGGMNAVFYKCDLVMNTSDASSDVAYITAAQQASGRGYLMYNCTVTSTTPGVDTASLKESKPGYFGRPWQAGTSEVVFYKTIIEATSFSDSLKSLIEPVAWLNSLSGESSSMYEYGTMECLQGVDNSANRAAWSTVLTSAKLADGTDISSAEKAVTAFLGSWKPFELDAADDTAVIVIPTPTTPEEETKIVLKADDITAGSYKSSFTVNGFTIMATDTAAVDIDTNSKTDEDGTSYKQRIKLGGAGTVNQRSIHFTTGLPATVKVYALSSSSSVNRKLNLYKFDGTFIASIDAPGSGTKVGTVELNEAGDYYLVSPDGGVNVYGVIVTMKGTPTEPERNDWATVAAPVITNVEQSGAKIKVTFNLETGLNGADKAIVTMLDEAGVVKGSVEVGKDETTITRTAEFTPVSSGNYRFKVVAERTDETTKKESLESSAVSYILPLATPMIKETKNLGNGNVQVQWSAVKEADSYIVSYLKLGSSTETVVGTVSETSKVINGLDVGSTYTIYVKAVRADDRSNAAESSIKVSQESQRSWYFSAFGSGVSTTSNYFVGDANEGSVTVASEDGKGKLVPASTDGLAFYYTAIDADTENFILSATVNVNSWRYSNGQEGFGLMAADAVGINGDSSVFWNNSYMNSVTKVEYLWDSEQQKVSDTGEKISMKLGVGAQEKLGVTSANIADGTTINYFKSSMSTLETSKASSGAGTYNIVGNYTNDDPPTGTDETVTSFKLKIQRDNTGYRLSYTDPSGKTTTKIFFDLDRNALSQIDKDNIYVGFFASRYAKITVTDIDLKITDPATDPPAEERGITFVSPSYSVISTSTIGVPDYELVFKANADGIVTIKDSKGNIIVRDLAVTANRVVKKKVTLALGTNQYIVEFTPNADYKPSEFERLSSYETAVITHNVVYKNYTNKVLYVSPSGSQNGIGSKTNPLDIYTAVKYAKPGQMILLAGGTYSLTKTVTIARGVSGTSDQRIIMMGDPSSSTRPVFNFNKACAGMIFAGDYWYIKGIDVTGSSDGQKGLQLSGSNNVLDQVNAYNNGNTGIQLSRYLTSDNFEDWPANNVILNCTSYGNADKGYEDADGFAAKLTIGEGNVFDGCIAYNNADDGWDLFAKVETGKIGKVLIKNCVAYGNGYLPDGTNAGNGNGFKLGGSSITGYHTLVNSIAFNNKAKGIDSNSCPDIQVYTSTSFNNGSYNVALYTNDAANTDYFADGIISYRTEALDVSENVKPKGTQDTNKFNGPSNYYWDVVSQSSKNKAGDVVSADWFVSLDTQITVTRNSDGTINMNGLLELTDKAPACVGARMTGRSSENPEIPEETTPTPSPVTTPTLTPEAKQDDAKDKVIELKADAKGNIDWDKAINELKTLLDENSNSDVEVTVTINLNNSKTVSGDLLETVQGTDTTLVLNVGNGISWTIEGKNIQTGEIKDVDFTVQQGTNAVPQALINQLLKSQDSHSGNQQISLAHEGVFGFEAQLTIDLSNVIDGKNKSLKLIASIFYYDPSTHTLTLQSVSRVNNGKANFSFSHASDYVVVLSDEAIINQETLNQVTVNGVTAGKTKAYNLYLGGTTGKSMQLEISIPDSIKEAIDKGLVEYSITHTSSDKNVASALRVGKIVANGVGTATIRTKIVIGDKTLVFDSKVTVKKASIKFTQTTKELQVGKTASFKIAAYGYDLKDLIWMTNKKGISVVGKNVGKSSAKVTAKQVGKEYVSVKVKKANGTYLTLKTLIKVVPAK